LAILCQYGACRGSSRFRFVSLSISDAIIYPCLMLIYPGGRVIYKIFINFSF
jgi:hypothetical protein